MVTEAEQIEIDENINLIKKICAKFQSQDRKVRKQAYIELEKCFSDVNFSSQDFRKIFSENYVFFLNGLRDKSETVREQAIKFIKFLAIDKLPLSDFYLTYIFPVLIERIGTVEVVEDSEEIRLQLLQFLNLIIIKYSNTEQLKPFMNDCITILCECVKDKFPSLKELSCQVIVKLAQALPRDFHLQAESLLKPVISCFSHQRYKVRVEAIKAVGEIVMHSSYKGVDEAMVPMAEKLFDQIPIVRQTIAQQAARWMMFQRDRYSYFYKMLPLLLTGLNDEVESTRVESHLLWEKVGLQYQQENEKDLKDKLDYLADIPKSYPTKLKRPNLGCRILVQRNISKLASALSNELTSWQEDIRVRCSQLLCSIALHAEEDLTFNLQNLFPAMYSAARDDDQRVVDNIIEASEIIGLFVQFESWSKIILPVIEDGPHYGHLTILASLLKGAPKENVGEAVHSVSKILSEDYICCSRNKKYQLNLLRCVRTLMEKCYNNNDDTGYYLFKIITSILALKDPDISEDITTVLYDDLAQCLNLSSKMEVLEIYSNRLLMHVNESPKTWTVVNEKACIFLLLLLETQGAFGLNLDIIGDILNEVLNEETNPEMRLKTFYVLASVFDNKDIIFLKAENKAKFLETLITDIFIPSLVWHAGATAEAIRTMAATCLKYILTTKLIPLLLSLTEDASFRSRQVSIECLTLLKQIYVNKHKWDIDLLLKIYPELLKRLDDPIDKVRLCALTNLTAFFEHVPEEFAQANFKAHRELIVDTLMTHFDDDDEIVQNLSFDSLKKLAILDYTTVMQKVEVHRQLLRNQRGCDELINFIQNYIMI
ncbi:dynein axonemal assembly factor 5 isoform X2 [Rhynchophorus ferrugineus]|uniref:dynein axonemal assembly factor 5 isoform X2 n=1 Tax=Rhynchophorus ferrugineus TaxID=354439 RepID=UPI003FCD1ECB